MNRLNLLLALCALVFICCTSSCGSNGADVTAAALTGATPAIGADGQDSDEIVGKSVSNASCSWKHCNRCWCQCPGQVKNLKATSNAANIGLTWDAISNAHGYRINYRIQGAPKWSFAGFSNTNSFTFTCGMAGCTMYEFRVRALSCYCAGKWSATVTSFIGGDSAAAVPGAVTGLTLTGGDTTITANWTAVTGAESYTLQYRLAGTTDWIEAGIGTDTTFELTDNLAACSRYEVRVRATNCRGDGDWSARPPAGWATPSPRRRRRAR